VLTVLTNQLAIRRIHATPLISAAVLTAWSRGTSRLLLGGLGLGSGGLGLQIIVLSCLYVTPNHIFRPYM